VTLHEGFDARALFLAVVARALRALAPVVFALIVLALCTPETRAQYPFVPPPVACMDRSEGPGILASLASTRAAEIPRRDLAVLQFTQLPTREEPDAALAGLRDRLVARLRAVRPKALREYVGPAEIRAEASQDRLVELATVGKQLNVEHLLVGKYSQSGGSAEISLEVFDAVSGKRLWQTTRTASASDLLQLEPELARLVAAHEFGALTVKDSVALSERATDDGVAYAHYLRGVAYLGEPASLEAATSELRAASQRAPKLAIGMSALASAYTRRAATMHADSAARDSLLRLATAAANRAISLDPKAPQAWIARGEVLAGGHPHRLTAARTAYERALMLDPLNADAQRQLGHVLLLMGTVDLAQSHLLRAVSLNPEDATPLVDLGELELNQHAFGQSCRALDLALSIDPRMATAYELRAMARLHRGDVRPAWIDAETGRRLGAELAGQAVSVVVDVAAHDTVSAREHIKALRRQVELKKWVSANDGGYVALGLVAVGDRAGALKILERVRPRDEELHLILRRPGFDPLWTDLRFRRLLEASSAGVTK
jgi:tetratricopeptide (TPR) repeat protein